LWVDFRTSLKRSKLADSESGKRLEKLIGEIEPALVVLK